MGWKGTYPWLMMALALVWLPACSSKYQRAETLARQGKFLEAEALFEQLVRADPKNPELLERRSRARLRALEQLLSQSRDARREGDWAKARPLLESFLSYRGRWNVHLDGGLQSSLADELEAVREQLTQDVAQEAAGGNALKAERQLGRWQSLLARQELVSLRDQMQQSVAGGAAAVCQKLRERPSDKPRSHLDELAWRYCDHFGIRVDPPLPPSGTAVALALEVQLSGAPGSLNTSTEDWVQRAFLRSPWYSARSTERLPAKVTGEWQARVYRQPIGMSANWVEQVPYQATELVSEPYQEKVTVMETVSEQEPYTENETYTYPCGTSTCTGTRPVQKTRTVQVQKPVTREQTKYREVSREVTRYREVPRVFNYEAVQVTANYRAGFSFKAEMEPRKAPVLVSLTDRLSQSDQEHEVTFAPARVLPKRSRLPSGETWFQAMLSRFVVDVRRQLYARWKESFCSAGAFNEDEAARCARAGTPLPAPAVAVLTPIWGDDAHEVQRLFEPE